MADLDRTEPKEPSARAVRFGRIVFCVVGSAMLGIAGWFSYHNPNDKVLLATGCLTVGLVFVWLGLALPGKIVAHFGFWLPWFPE